MSFNVHELVKVGPESGWRWYDGVPMGGNVGWIQNVIFDIIELIGDRAVIGNHRQWNGGPITNGVTGAIWVGALHKT
jgi:hypothetical protein